MLNLRHWLFSVCVVFLFLTTANAAEKLLQEIELNYSKNTLSVAKEKEFAATLRRLFVEAMNTQNPTNLSLITRGFKLLLNNLHAQVSDVNPEELKQAGNSVGVALESKLQTLEDQKRQTALMIREAGLMLYTAFYRLQEYCDPTHPEYRAIVEFFNQTAYEGVPDSQLFYGYLLLSGERIKQNIPEGIALLKASNTPNGYHLLANHYGIEGQTDERIKCLQTLVQEFKDDLAAYRLALWTLKTNPTQAFHMMQEIVQNQKPYSKLGNSIANIKLKLAEMLIQGNGVEQNPRQGVSILLEVANDTKVNNQETKAQALSRLSYCYLTGIGVSATPEIREKGMEFLSAVTELTRFNRVLHDVQNAAYAVGQPQDKLRAFEMIDALTEDKNLPLQAQAIAWLNLGWFYQDGVGTKINLEKAKQCFAKSVELGNIDAQRYLDELAKK
jgi:TPR repeat protein